jgi:hypothetical protein
MDREEIVGRLRANVDKVVKVCFGDGNIQTIKVHVVDDDGIVYFLVVSNEVDKQAYWTVFDDIKNVESLRNSK